MQKYIILFIVVFLSACTTIAPSQTYRPRGHDDAWSITGQREEGPLTDNIQVMINGELVIDGQTDLAGNGSLVGQYQGKSIEAICHHEHNERLVDERINH